MGYLTYLGSPIPMETGPYYSVFYKFATYLQGAIFFFVQWNKKRQTEFYEQMTSNPAFTKRNVQKANAYRFQCI